MKTRRVKHRTRIDAGFTLIEVLVAMTILAIGVLAVSTLQLSATRNTATGDVLAMGLAVAENRIELLRSADPALLEDVIDGLPTAAAATGLDTACGADASYNTITYTVTCAYALVCDAPPCPPLGTGLQSVQFSVQVTAAAALNNPIVLTGKIPQ